MGYYTYYTLKWEPMTDVTTRRQCEHQIPTTAKFCPECGLAIGEVALTDDIQDYILKNENMNYAIATGEQCKWYNHDDDMRHLSETHPNFLFTLIGEGEDAVDLWHKYYLAGKCQVAKAKIEYDHFDRTKLK